MSEKSFWVKAKDEEYAEPDILDGLAKKFSSKPTKKMDDVADKTNDYGTMKKVKELKVLDGKSAQNISILLGGSLKHMPYDEIKKALLRCDEQILSENITEQLIQERIDKYEEILGVISESIQCGLRKNKECVLRITFCDRCRIH